MNRNEAWVYMGQNEGKPVECDTELLIFKYENGTLWMNNRRDTEWHDNPFLPQGTYQPHTPKPEHKQLCECWMNEWTHGRKYKFYDGINDRTYFDTGKPNGAKFDNMIPIPYDQYPDWAIPASKTLED
jgi:hypothetical protein